MILRKLGDSEHNLGLDGRAKLVVASMIYEEFLGGGTT
jgi:hypothetical protein